MLDGTMTITVPIHPREDLVKIYSKDKIEKILKDPNSRIITIGDTIFVLRDGKNVLIFSQKTIDSLKVEEPILEQPPLAEENKEEPVKMCHECGVDPAKKNSDLCQGCLDSLQEICRSPRGRSRL